jgi:hypothetical protein
LPPTSYAQNAAPPFDCNLDHGSDDVGRVTQVIKSRMHAPDMAVRVAYLVVLAIAGLWLAARRFRRILVL